MFKGFLFLLLLVAALTGCAAQPSSPTSPSTGAEVGGYRELVDALVNAGATVEPSGNVEQSFFSVPGQVIRVNGQDVQVFEYDSEKARQAQSSQISSDGSSIGTSMVTWIDTPHFWAKGRIIVLYIGQDQETIDQINQEMGNPITQS